MYQGMDIRFFVRRTDASTDWGIAKPFESCIHRLDGGMVRVDCNPSFRGVAWHVQGFNQGSSKREKMTAGNTFKYVGPTMCVFAECRKA